jgi:hypothetical protein
VLAVVGCLARQLRGLDPIAVVAVGLMVLGVVGHIVALIARRHGRRGAEPAAGLGHLPPGGTPTLTGGVRHFPGRVAGRDPDVGMSLLRARAPARATQPPLPDQLDALRQALLAEMQEGRRLADTNAALRGAVDILGLHDAEGDVTEWEKRVAHLLNRAERWELADYFLADPPQPPPSARFPSAIVSAAAIGLGDPLLESRLDFRLTQLNTIINRDL